MRVVAAAERPASVYWRCVPSPGSNRIASPSQRSTYPLWLRCRVGTWLADPRTTSSRSDIRPVYPQTRHGRGFQRPKRKAATLSCSQVGSPLSVEHLGEAREEPLVVARHRTGERPAEAQGLEQLDRSAGETQRAGGRVAVAHDDRVADLDD